MSELKEGRRPVPPPSELNLRAGSFLFKEGDLSREVYIVKDGELSVTQRHGSQTVELARLGERSVLGEMSLLDNQPRSATVRALKDTKLTVIAPQTFQAILQVMPAWLLAVVKVVTRRIRDTNTKINQHTVANSLESICLFLFEKSKVYQLHYKQAPVFQWFSILDEIMLLTRMSREEIQKSIQVLVQRKLCTLNAQQEIFIADPTRLDILAQILSAERRKISFLPASLDSFSINCCELIEKIQEPWTDPKSLLLVFQNLIDPRVSVLQIEKLQELGVLVSNQGTWSFDIPRLQWVNKARLEMDLVLGRK